MSRAIAACGSVLEQPFSLSAARDPSIPLAKIFLKVNFPQAEPLPEAIQCL
jgi:hypothetical protein